MSVSTISQHKNKAIAWLKGIIGWVLGLVDLLVIVSRWFAPSNDYLFFADGFGNVRKVHQAQDQLTDQLRKGITPKSLIITDKDIIWEKPSIHGSVYVTKGQFQSPIAHLLPNESKMCHFYHVQPAQVSSTSTTATIILFPASGEIGKGKRLQTAKYLADNYGWSSIIITAPLYGVRKPKNQIMFIVRSIELIMLQAFAIMQEGVALALYSFNKNKKDHKVCFSGFSWGAAMTVAASTITILLSNERNRYSERLACAPYVGCTSPSVIMKGCLKDTLAWDVLKQEQKQQNDGFCDDDEEHITKQTYHALNYFRMEALTDIIKERREIAAMMKQQNNSDSRCNDNSSLYYVGSICGIAMKHDLIVTPKDTQGFVNEMTLLAKPSTPNDDKNFSNHFENSNDDGDGDGHDFVQWFVGGHAVASILQQRYQKEIIVKAVCGLSENRSIMKHQNVV